MNEFPKILVISSGDVNLDPIWAKLLGRTSDPILNRKLKPEDFLYYSTYSGSSGSIDGELRNAVSKAAPSAILALGSPALFAAAGVGPVEQLRGYIFPTSRGPVISTYSPEYIRRGKWNLARVVQLDILKALEVARDGADKFLVEKAYELSPDYRAAESFFVGWRAAGRPPIAFDIETPYADDAASNEGMTFEDDASYQILMCSFSFKPFEAISIPWQEPFISLIKGVFKEAPNTLVWNAKFDVPRLLASGVHFNGGIIDVMLAWHYLEPALPMGLKYVATFFCPDMGAWKLDMHRNFQWYNAADSDVLLRVYNGVVKQLEAQGRWTKFLRHFVDFGKILQRMTERGISIDHEARTNARNHFQQRFSGVVQSTQALAPTNILGVHPKRGYAKPPKELGGLVQLYVELTPKEVATREKRLDNVRKKAAKKAAIQARKNQREEAKRIKAVGKAASKRKGKLKP